MENINLSKEWLYNFEASKPLIIAGPCSVETEQQVMEVAKELAAMNVKIFRGGIWKPRTRPGGFEGVGAIGLKWLQRVKKETGMLIAVEVANATHVKLALEHDLDVLWIGARTTVNPFAVQEIADALENTDKIVLLKNPVNPDLSLWIGGLERLYNANIKNLGVIHRGFSSYEKTKYRNIPEWQIAIDLKNKFPNLVIIGDPSHISGRRDLIQEVSQHALDLNYDGLMIESHCNPDMAWSDAAQQVTPHALQEILSNLRVRFQSSESEPFNQEIEKLRAQIDFADSEILEILGKRMQISENIGKLKKEHNIAILQENRWIHVLQKMISEGKAKNLSESFIQRFYKAIHQESIDRQQ